MPTTLTTGVPARREIPDETATNARLWALVAEIQADPAGADTLFGELYRLTHPAVFRYIRSRVGSHHDAEDLAADVFLRARGRIDKLRPDSASPTAWLVTIARHLIFDHYKRSETRVTHPVAEVPGRTPEGRPEWVEARDRTVEDADAINLVVVLYAAVSRLTAEQREAVRLRYLLGQSVAVAAAAMGKQECAIKALTYRATRTMLRDPAVAGLGTTRYRFAA